MGTKLRACFLIALLVAAFGITVGTASGTTFNVGCGDVPGLRNAITLANADALPDIIEIADVNPCTFTLIDASVINAGSGNTGLPIVTNPLTINGHGATIARSTVGGTPQFRLFTTVALLELNDLTISGGSLNGANHFGAGVLSFLGNLVMNNVIVSSNGTFGAGGGGGGIATFSGELHVHRSSIAFNIATNGAGLNTNQTVTEVRRSIFAFNLAVNTGAAVIQGSTGTFENDTFAANQATNNNLGGLLVANSAAVPATVTVASSTFADNGRNGNTAPGGALFAIANGADVTINVTDTIVTDTDSTAPAVLAPCATLSITGHPATINDNGGNLEWPHNTCGFDTNANPQLAALADNGGGTATYRLLPTSPAIDLGGGDCPATDQRGEARPDGDGCDTGSFETNPPETTADGPDGPTNDPQITFTSDEEGSTFQCSVDGADPVACTSPFDPGVTEDGEHTVTVTAIDSEGYFDPSPASVTFVLDTTAPVVEITNSPTSPTNDNTADIEFTVDDGDADVTCQVDADAPVSCSSPFTTDALDDGEHTITVTATDEAGNTGSDSVTFDVDATAPVVEITSSPSSPTNDNTADIEFTVDDGDADVTCQVDDGEPAECSSPFTTEALMDGEHTIIVSATDAAGNTGSDSVTFVVGASTPDTTITSGPSGVVHSASATFTFESDDDDATFECRVDDGDWASCTSPHSVTVEPGVHTFEVRAIDSIGNADPTPASRTWEYQVCRLVRIGPFNLFGIVITVCL